MTAPRSDGPAPTIQFASADGSPLIGDLSAPADPVMAAVVCHPHPQYGGNRFNPVVGAIHRELPANQIASFRFDFRAEFDDGVGEVRDVEAAIATVRDLVPDVPVALVGYSFGAVMALRVRDSELAARVLIAPPLAMAGDATPPAQPTLILTPEHDQFTTPSDVRAATDGWIVVEHETIDGADHFLQADLDDLAARSIEFLCRNRT